MYKTKGQQPLVAKLELLAPCFFCGGLAERSNATGLQPADGATTTVQGFKSLTRRQISNNTPAEALTPHRGKNRTAEAVQVRQPQYAAFGCESQGDLGKPVARLLPVVRLLQLLPRSPTLRVTPAMAAGVSACMWDISDLV